MTEPQRCGGFRSPLLQGVHAGSEGVAGGKKKQKNSGDSFLRGWGLYRSVKLV